MFDMKNPHAQALGRLNKGGKKTMTPAAILQRTRASQKAAEQRSKKKRPNAGQKYGRKKG
jgi:hypothetical protein